MANRRMFSKSITSSSKFLMMPLSAQALYFHFGMNADDDGFCEHFSVMRMVEAKPDDLKVLQAKGLVKVFDEKVLVILDWKENNFLRSDRYTPSKYLQEYKDEVAALSGIPVVNQRYTQVRLGKVINTGEIGISQELRIEEDKDKPQREKKDTSYYAVFELWPDYPIQWKKNKTEIEAAKSMLAETDLDTLRWGLEIYQKYKKDPFCPQILKPSDLDRKWDNLLAFKKKHD